MPHVTWDSDISPVIDSYIEIVSSAKELDDYRVARREGRGRVIGGGFGVGGAIKGMTQAAAMNMAVGAAHMTFNAVAKTFSLIGDELKKDKLFKSKSTEEIISNALLDFLFQVHRALIDAVNNENPGRIVIPISEERKEKARRIFSIISSGLSNKEEIDDLLVQTIQINPYWAEPYLYWLSKNGDSSHELEEIASHFGIQAVGKEKINLLDLRAKSSRPTKDAPDLYVQHLKELRDYAQFIGCSEVERYLQQVRHEALKMKLDTLDTSSAAECKRAILILADFSHQIDCEAPLFEQFISDLEETFTLLDKQSRTFEGVEYSTLKECDDAKNERLHSDNLATSSVFDLFKIGLGMFLIVLSGLLMVSSQEKGANFFAITFASLTLAASGALFKGIRSLRAMRWAIFCGYGVLALLFTAVIVGIVIATKTGAEYGGPGILDVIIFSACSWFIIKSTNTRFNEAGYGETDSHIGKALAASILLSAVLSTTAVWWLNAHPATHSTDADSCRFATECARMQAASSTSIDPVPPSAPIKDNMSSAPTIEAKDESFITCKYNESENMCYDLNPETGISPMPPSEFVRTKGYSHILAAESYDDPQTHITYLRMKID